MNDGRHPIDASSKKDFTFIEETPKGIFLRVRLQPRSSKNSVEGVANGSLRLKLTAPPVEGSANKALIEYLSELTGAKKSAISIESGLKSRDKRVRVEGISTEELQSAFAASIK